MRANKGHSGTLMLLFDNMAVNMNGKISAEHNDGL